MLLRDNRAHFLKLIPLHPTTQTINPSPKRPPLGNATSIGKLLRHEFEVFWVGAVPSLPGRPANVEILKVAVFAMGLFELVKHPIALEEVAQAGVQRLAAGFLWWGCRVLKWEIALLFHFMENL